MTDFKTAIQQKTKCPECGKTLLPLYGEGVLPDVLFCSNTRECNYEKEFDTSTKEKESKSWEKQDNRQ